ncbi:hypothetical protein GGR51DRAFT_344546 [Nemania sp. FL0031]|nr:hypothetical protein GGR51DRAFT_344546 [Nemania sp. FL0031]
MDGAGIPEAVAITFQVIYITSRFIYREVSKVKGFHDGKMKMVSKYRYEIARLEAFWVVLTHDAKTIAELSSKGPPYLLSAIHVILMEIRNAMNPYSQLAREVDEEYQRYCGQSSILAADAKTAAMELPPDIDEAIGLTVKDLDTESVSDGDVQPKSGGFFSFLSGGGPNKKLEKSSSEIAPFKLKELPQGIAWCFQERQLTKSLNILKSKVTELYGLSPSIVMGLDLNSIVGRKVNTGGGTFNVFKGHMQLQKMAKDNASGRPVINVEPIPWETMKGYINDSQQSSSTILVERKDTGNFPRDSMKLPAIRERKEEEKYAPQLASLLASSSETFVEETTIGTLPFKGFAKDPTPNGCFSFAFNYPKGAASDKPLSLRFLILSKRREHKLSLNDRFNIAKMISRYLGTLHSDGWLHKSICSQAIKFFFTEMDKIVLLDTSTPYLTDFGFSRPLDAYSAPRDAASRAVDLDVDVYRHPDRFGQPSQYFNTIHDIYSLGVVLLEIGTWKTARQIYDKMFREEDPTGEDVKEAFIRYARQELSHSMGSAYRDAVLLCLDGEKLREHLHEPSFAVEFQKNVVRKVDVALLNPETTDFVDEAEPPRYDDIAPP